MMPGKRMNAFVLCLALGACGQKAGAKDEKPGTREAMKAEADEHPDHKDEPAHDALPRRVKLTPEVEASAHVRTSLVTSERLSKALTLPGEIVADPSRMARISTPIAGRLVTVDFQEGALVQRGQILAVVSIPDLGRIGAEQAGAQARAQVARSNAERLHVLVEKGLAGRQEWLAAQADAKAFQAEAGALSRQLGALGPSRNQGRSPGLSLPAPMSGVVVSRDAVVGQPVAQADTLGAIADLSEVWFLARVFERDLSHLHEGAKAIVQLNAFPKERFEGQVESIGRQVDATARTVTARIRLTNRADMLRVGLFGLASVSTGEEDATPRLVVPESAVTEIAGKSVVFVHQKDGDYEMHEVVLGQTALDRIAVVSGLRLGEDVVVDGVFTLKSMVLRGSLVEED